MSRRRRRRPPGFRKAEELLDECMVFECAEEGDRFAQLSLEAAQVDFLTCQAEECLSRHAALVMYVHQARQWYGRAIDYAMLAGRPDLADILRQHDAALRAAYERSISD